MGRFWYVRSPHETDQFIILSLARLAYRNMEKNMRKRMIGKLLLYGKLSFEGGAHGVVIHYANCPSPVNPLAPVKL